MFPIENRIHVFNLSSTRKTNDNIYKAYRDFVRANPNFKACIVSENCGLICVQSDYHNLTAMEVYGVEFINNVKKMEV
jgi:hypothetical protein